MKKLIASNIDALALALIIALLVPGFGTAHPRLSLILAGNLEQRGTQVWQRLEQRMQQFEARFSEYSVPPARTACLNDAEAE